jgi:hypothetical protein
MFFRSRAAHASAAAHSMLTDAARALPPPPTAAAMPRHAFAAGYQRRRPPAAPLIFSPAIRLPPRLFRTSPRREHSVSDRRRRNARNSQQRLL